MLTKYRTIILQHKGMKNQVDMQTNPNTSNMWIEGCQWLLICAKYTSIALILGLYCRSKRTRGRYNNGECSNRPTHQRSMHKMGSDACSRNSPRSHYTAEKHCIIANKYLKNTIQTLAPCDTQKHTPIQNASCSIYKQRLAFMSEHCSHRQNYWINKSPQTIHVHAEVYMFSQLWSHTHTHIVLIGSEKSQHRTAQHSVT